MRIKHWAGYGCIQGERIGKITKNPDGDSSIHIRLSGNHECGLERDYTYDIETWLLPRFVKSPGNKCVITDMKINSGWDSVKKEDTCDYFIKYRLQPA